MLKNLALLASTSLLALGCADESIGSSIQHVKQETGMTHYVSGPVEDSKGKVKRDDAEFAVKVKTTALEGHAYTMWVCGFNDPQACMASGVTPSCGWDDWDTAGGFCDWSAGAVADDNSGKLKLVGGAGAGLTNTTGAEIALIVRGHGPALTGDDLEAQLTTFDGGCDVNVCQDEQFASFAAGDGRQTTGMTHYVTGPVEDSKAKIKRSDAKFAVKVKTTALEGHAYTMWVCGFNDPQACMASGVTPSCGWDDWDTAGGFCDWSAGAVADDNSGKLKLVGGAGAGLTNTTGAEIALIVRGHGPALTGDDLEAQLTTFDGGCDVNVCQDEQFASFAAAD